MRAGVSGPCEMRELAWHTLKAALEREEITSTEYMKPLPMIPDAMPPVPETTKTNSPPIG